MPLLTCLTLALAVGPAAPDDGGAERFEPLYVGAQLSLGLHDASRFGTLSVRSSVSYRSLGAAIGATWEHLGGDDGGHADLALQWRPLQLVGPLHAAFDPYVEGGALVGGIVTGGERRLRAGGFVGAGLDLPVGDFFAQALFGLGYRVVFMGTPSGSAHLLTLHVGARLLLF